MLGIDDAVTAVANVGSKLIDRLIPDPAAAAQAKLDLEKMVQTGELARLAADTTSDTAQAAVNQVEAGNLNKFVSYWRPTVGWLCAIGFGYADVVVPVASGVAYVLGYDVSLPPTPPELNWTLTGLLGLTHASRTFEKTMGVARS